ncbi:MAG: LD-carboxypeptidase [Leptothrix sp. (in: Bacteria)]|nr:LD-carboxypeptidase [Leptothrix sp. (in: b-proteobacteria)]
MSHSHHPHDHSHSHDHHHHGHDHPHSLTLFSPAGVVPKATTVRRAAKRLQGLGFETLIDDSALDKHQRFAGDDDTRLQALHRIAQAAPCVALATRGGYGLSRLLDRIDWALIAQSVEQGTAWVGHSDMTALQLAALAHGATGPMKVAPHVSAGFWAGPMACGDFGSDELPDGGDDVTQECFVEAVTGLLEGVGFRTEAGFDGLDVSGRLWGGNLSMIQALLGTPHFPKVKDGVLFLEDVNEHPYRVERALLQLHQAGILDKQKAIILGDFTNFRKSPLDRGYNLKTMVAYLRTVTKTPILTGLPFGHVPTKLCLPIGRKVQMAAQGRDVFMMW